MEDVQPYFKAKELHHQNAIASISKLITDQKWDLGGFGIFQGGLTIDFHGKSIRVPHRVAAIAELIKEFEQSNDNNLYKLYEDIREKAKEGLDTPRSGQKKVPVFFIKMF